MTDKQSAWSDFWAQQRGGGDNGCLPARWQSVIAVLEQTWRSVAEDLAEDAGVEFHPWVVGAKTPEPAQQLVANHPVFFFAEAGEEDGGRPF